MQANTVPASVFIPLPLLRPRMMTGHTELEPDICWQAMRSRDRRFDGRFFVAALTTGIYCRPICPVPFAKQNNIALYPCAAAAEAAWLKPGDRGGPTLQCIFGRPLWLSERRILVESH